MSGAVSSSRKCRSMAWPARLEASGTLAAPKTADIIPRLPLRLQWRLRVALRYHPLVTGGPSV